MYQPNRILERELEFTKIYRENIGQPKAVRESRCMDAQMATYFVTIQQGIPAQKLRPRKNSFSPDPASPVPV